jgi:hypothetical protein
MLIRVRPHDVLGELVTALVSSGCLVLHIAPGLCRAVPVRRGREARTELRFFVDAWAKSRGAAVEFSGGQLAIESPRTSGFSIKPRL